MKKTLLFFLSTFWGIASLHAQGVEFFSGTLEEAFIEAKASGKKVFIDFYTDWCGPCKAVSNKVFPAQEAGKFFNEHFINVKIDAEKGSGPALAKEYEINGYPTFMVLGSSKETIARWTGASMNPTPESFINIVKKNTKMDIQEQEGIVMRTITLDEALKIAKDEKKYVLIDIYTDWCGPCKMMEREVFPRKDVGEYVNPNFVFIKCNAEKGEGPSIAKRFNVRGYPTYIILDIDGKTVHSFSGSRSPEGFIAILKGALDESMSLEALQARYEAGDRDKQFMKDYSAMLASSYNKELGASIQTMYNNLLDVEKTEPQYWFIFERMCSPGSDYEKFLLENRTRFNNSIGEEKVNSLIRLKYLDLYTKIYFSSDGEKTNKDLKDADALAEKIGLNTDSEIKLYRALANIKINNAVDEFLDIFATNKHALKNEVSFLQPMIFLFSGLFSSQQKGRLFELVETDKARELIEGMGTK